MRPFLQAYSITVDVIITEDSESGIYFSRSVFAYSKMVLRKTKLVSLLKYLGLLVAVALIVHMVEVYLQLTRKPTEFTTSRPRPVKRREQTQTNVKCNGPLDAVLIGINKCGTTTLQNFALIHPDIINLNIPWTYHDHPEEPTSKSILETKCTPSNKAYMTKIHHLSNPRKVFGANPKMKLIVIVCDPVRRYLSAFTHYEMERLNYDKINPSDYANLQKILNSTFSCVETKTTKCHQPKYSFDYPGLMEKWLPFFDLEQIHIVDGDGFKTNPVKQLKKLEKFLGVRPFIKDSHFVYDEKKGFYCKRLAQESVCMGDDKGRKHPDLPKHYIAGLKRYHKPYNERFFQLINQTFPWNE